MHPAAANIAENSRGAKVTKVCRRWGWTCE